MKQKLTIVRLLLQSKIKLLVRGLRLQTMIEKLDTRLMAQKITKEENIKETIRRENKVMKRSNTSLNIHQKNPNKSLNKFMILTLIMSQKQEDLGERKSKNLKMTDLSSLESPKSTKQLIEDLIKV